MYDPPPPELRPPLQTKSGKILTDEDIERLADEAERGYELTDLASRPRTMAEVYHSHSGRARQIWSLVTWRYVVVALVVGFFIGAFISKWLP